MTDYHSWCQKVQMLPLNLPGVELGSANKIRVVTLEDGEQVLLKLISPERPYVPRIKALGEVAYALFDWHLNPAERVTPNVCAVSANVIWRQYLPGWPGELWRGELYKENDSLEDADLLIVDRILESKSAQRIALLDFIFLCQDRSARNWIMGSYGRFYAIDNGIFWAYKERFGDRQAFLTGSVDHLRPPMEALVSCDSEYKFQNGVFSSLYTGRIISDGLLAWLYQINWDHYLFDLGRLCCPLGYPPAIVIDWQFEQLRNRLNWLLEKRRFPTVSEAYGEWQNLITRPPDGAEIWTSEWETKNLESE